MPRMMGWTGKEALHSQEYPLPIELSKFVDGRSEVLARSTTWQQCCCITVCNQGDTSSAGSELRDERRDVVVLFLRTESLNPLFHSLTLEEAKEKRMLV